MCQTVKFAGQRNIDLWSNVYVCKDTQNYRYAHFGDNIVGLVGAVCTFSFDFWFLGILMCSFSFDFGFWLIDVLLSRLSFVFGHIDVFLLSGWLGFSGQFPLSN